MYTGTCTCIRIHVYEYMYTSIMKIQKQFSLSFDPLKDMYNYHVFVIAFIIGS